MEELIEIKRPIAMEVSDDGIDWWEGLVLARYNDQYITLCLDGVCLFRYKYARPIKEMAVI
jgi:hypothetical protein